MLFEKKILLMVSVVELLLVSFVSFSEAITYNPTSDFSITNGNPNGVWSYGWMPNDFSTLNLYQNTTTTNGPQWYTSGLASRNDNTPAIWLNTSGVTLFGVASGQLSLHPSERYEPSVLRFTAPTDGLYDIIGTFFPGTSDPWNSGICQIGVRQGSEWLWQGVDSGSFNMQDIELITNETVDFVVYGFYAFGNTPLQLTISSSSSTTPTPVPAAVWLFGSGLIGLAGVRRRFQK